MSDQNPSTCLTIDPNAEFVDLVQGVSERINKAADLVRLVEIAANDRLDDFDRETVSHALWPIRTLLEEADALHDRMLEVHWKKEQASQDGGPKGSEKEKTSDVELSDRAYTVVQGYATEHGITEAEAVHQMALERLKARMATPGEARAEA